VAARGDLRAADVDLDVVPVIERIEDLRRTLGSAACRLPRVWSEKTTPQPKVSYGLFRSTTTISCEGSCRFISSAK
jgi:hypothetical protein